MISKHLLYKGAGFLVILFIMQAFSIHESTDECDVLLDRINESYAGECKKGLAHGDGLAIGRDRYEGEFKKGYPDGYGVCLYENKSKYEGYWSKGLIDGKGTMYLTSPDKKDSVLTGYWKRGNYIGEYDKLHNVNFTQNVSKVKFKYVSDKKNRVEVRLQRGGNRISSVTYFDLTSATGASIRLVQYGGIFDDLEFPFEGKVRYTVPTILGGSQVTGRVEFQVLKPGHWVCTIESL